MNIIRLTAAAVCAVALQAPAQTTQRFTASKANEYGLVYSLPVTQVCVTVETEHTVRTPGEFYNYARRHLAISDAITTPSTTVTVKSVIISTEGVADDGNRWNVQFKSGQTPYMLLTSDGRPLTVNSETPAEPATPALPVARPAEPTILETPAARQAMTPDMIRSSSISKRAELAAQRIFELRDMRSDLLSGQADNAPADGKAMQLVLDNLANQESALTAMFAGTESTWTSVRTLSFVPDSLDSDRFVIGRVSPFDGVVDADNLAGAPLTVEIEVLEYGTLPKTEKNEPKKFPKGGVAYTIPGTAKVSVMYDGRTIATADVVLAQFGATFGVDPSLFSDKKAPSKLLFDPATGGILLLGPAE